MSCLGMILRAHRTIAIVEAVDAMTSNNIPEEFPKKQKCLDKGGVKMARIIVIPEDKLILTEEQQNDLIEILRKRSSGELKQMGDIIRDILSTRGVK